MISAYQGSLDKSLFLANTNHIRLLLWLHSQFISIPVVMPRRYLKLPWVNRKKDLWTRVAFLEVLYDQTIKTLRFIRTRAPAKFRLLSARYGALPHEFRNDAIDELLSLETPAQKAERRKKTIADIAQGYGGPLGRFFAINPKTGRAPLEMIYMLPDRLILLCVNTHQAQQAIGGDNKTSHCISKRGETGASYFEAYAALGSQYMLLFPQTGTMVAAQFTGDPNEEGNHEDHNNESVVLQKLIRREMAYVKSPESGHHIYKQCLFALLAHIAKAGQKYSDSRQASEFRLVNNMLARRTDDDRRRRRRLLKAIASQNNPFVLYHLADMAWHGSQDALSALQSATNPALPENIALYAVRSLFPSLPETISSRYARRYTLPQLLKQDDRLINKAIIGELIPRVDAFFKDDGLAASKKQQSNRQRVLEVFGQLARSKHSTTYIPVVKMILGLAKRKPGVARQFGAVCWPSLSRKNLPAEYAMRLDNLMRPANPLPLRQGPSKIADDSPQNG